MKKNIFQKEKNIFKTLGPFSCSEFIVVFILKAATLETWETSAAKRLRKTKKNMTLVTDDP